MTLNLPEKPKPSARRKWRSIGLFLLAAVYACAAYTLVGFSINLPPVRPIDRLNEARARWNMQQIDDYRLKLRFFSGNGSVGSVWVTVEDEAVTRVDEAAVLCGRADNCLTYDPATAAPVTGGLIWYYGISGIGLNGSFLPMLQDYTMSAIFDLGEKKLKNDPAPPLIAWCPGAHTPSFTYQASYDPGMGYVESLRASNCTEFQFGGGLMCGGFTTHCATGFTVEKLEPLPEAAP